MAKLYIYLLLIVFTLSAGTANGYSRKLRRRDNLAKDDVKKYWQKLENYIAGENENGESEEEETWNGRWLPARPDDPSPPPKVLHKTGVFRDSNIKESGGHRVGMGIQPYKCDDGKSNLRIDWNWSPVNYTCYGDKIVPSYSIDPMLYCEHIPSSYVPIHKCMNETIKYDDDIPMYGSHRPVWPAYGEYKFLPRQRWIHSLEHGAIVMLYHPCANPLEVNRLKKILSGCMRRYIISPYTLLDEDRPLALVSWGCRLTMSYVTPSVVRKFIINKSLRGPEEIASHGRFSEYIIKLSEIVSDQRDSVLCPDM